MQAVVEINGKQYQVEEGRYLKVDSLSQSENEVLELGNVLMIIDEQTTLLGAPFVEGARITAKVRAHGRDPKVLVYKMRCKKGYRRKNGHRQGFTHLQIESVEYPGRVTAIKKAIETPSKAKKAEKPANESTEVKEKPAKKATAPKTEAAKSAARKPAAKKEAAPKKAAKKAEESTGS